MFFYTTCEAKLISYANSPADSFGAWPAENQLQ